MAHFTAHALAVHGLGRIVRFDTSVDHEGGVLPCRVVLTRLFTVEQFVLDPGFGHDVLAALTAEVVLAHALGRFREL